VLNEAVILGEIGGEVRDLPLEALPSLDRRGFSRERWIGIDKAPGKRALAAMTNVLIYRSAAIDDLTTT